MDQRLEMLWGGCSAVGWQTEDGKALWARNMDFNRMAAGSAPTYLPKGTVMTAAEGVTAPAKYAAVGMGLLAVPGLPLLYDGVNEAGLMGGQLYFRGLARYADGPEPGKQPMQPPLLVGWMLSQCATLDQVAQALEQAFTLVNTPLLGAVSPLHWSFSDCTGEVMVVESDANGLHIYRNTVGVMTNSPSYDWHRTNLLNYAAIRDLDYDTVEMGGERLEQCFSGSGAQGLPGDAKVCRPGQGRKAGHCTATSDHGQRSLSPGDGTGQPARRSHGIGPEYSALGLHHLHRGSLCPDGPFLLDHL